MIFRGGQIFLEYQDTTIDDTGWVGIRIQVSHRSLGKILANLGERLAASLGQLKTVRMD